MVYQCVLENFMARYNKSKKYKSKTHKHTKKRKKSKHKSSDKIYTKSNISLESSLNENKYIKFSYGNNLLLIYCLLKKVKKYSNFIPVIGPVSSFNMFNYYNNNNIIIPIPGKINYFGCRKKEIQRWIIKLAKRPERFLLIDILIKVISHPDIPSGSKHGNIIIFDTEKNEVYHIEPHGVNNLISKKNFNEFKDFFEHISPGCRFYEHRDFLEFLPFQKTDAIHTKLYKSTKSKDVEGYCFYWCIYLVNIILKFSNLPIQVILKQTYDSLMSYSIGEAKITDFHRHIRSWGQRLEQNVIKEYPKINSQYRDGLTLKLLNKQLSEIKSVFNL